MAIEQDMNVYIEKALSKIIPSSQLKVVKGYFEDTLDSHLPNTKAALIHMDCDLYSSAKYVLGKLLAKGRVSKKAIFGPHALTGFWIQEVTAVSLMPGGPAFSRK